MPTGTTRFVTNLMEHASTYVQWNGDNAVEVASNPVSNLKVADRYCTAVFPASGGSFCTLFVDFGRNVSVDKVGVLNVDTGGQVAPYSCYFSPVSTTAAGSFGCSAAAGSTVLTLSSTTNVAAYSQALVVVSGPSGIVSSQGTFITNYTNGSSGPPIVYSTLTLSKPISGTADTVAVYPMVGTNYFVNWSGFTRGSDAWTALPSAVTYRKWVVTFPFIQAGFSIGGLFFGAPESAGDLGISFSPSSSITTRRQRLVTPTVGGLFVKDEYGRPYTEYSMRFSNVPQAVVDKLRTYAARMPVLMIDAYNTIHHVDLSDDTLRVTSVWGSPDTYDIEFGVRSLP